MVRRQVIVRRAMLVRSKQGKPGTRAIVRATGSRKTPGQPNLSRVSKKETAIPKSRSAKGTLEIHRQSAGIRLPGRPRRSANKCMPVAGESVAEEKRPLPPRCEEKHSPYCFLRIEFIWHGQVRYYETFGTPPERKLPDTY